ncbi:MAG: cell division protein FtsW [Acidobacteriaceae bacterium]|nr:cell division protein FtsW [Acidobacteriaceae bacterium]MBV9035012.1 cell division protein FtsW [Acidobacteriaceae bacterium]MBV9223026.1 cell division protein FtsW [Acidobacteriaceae bacterium]MBV9305138.1 cell division protein FtsW [Acidobacteriaceae bacterium]MBV9675780.1 cell division protein FtsW [Acidobacteriaceae bacterium]
MAQRLKTDWLLFLTVLAMVCFGLVMVYSASSILAELKFHVSGVHFFVRQLGWAVVSIAVLLFCMKRDYRKWNDPRIAFAGLGIVLLLLVIVYITDTGSHRWLKAGPLSLQPSELAKPALSLFLAFFLCRRVGAVNDKYTLAPIVVCISVIALAVAIADLGTAVVLVATTFAVVFVAGIEYRYLAVCGTLGILLGLSFIAMKPYRLARAIDFIDKDHKLLAKLDPNGRILKYTKQTASTSDPGYQQRQAKIAVGSGGFSGLGLMQSRQKILYLPEAQTDFIYGIVGEETGFLGSVALLLGFVIVLWRGLRTYARAADNFGRYLALSVTVCVVVQALINMSVVLDLVPNKGIPLPFMSYGGSSLLSTTLLMGMLLSVSEHTT